MCAGLRIFLGSWIGNGIRQDVKKKKKREAAMRGSSVENLFLRVIVNKDGLQKSM